MSKEMHCSCMLDWGWFLPSGFCPRWVWPCQQNSGDCSGSLPGLDSVPVASLPCPHLAGPAITYLCLAGLGGRRHLASSTLPPTHQKKEGKFQRKKKIKARQNIAILQHPWQLLRLPGKSPSLCVLQAAAWSSLPKWDQALHARGEKPCDFTHKKVVAQLGVDLAKS